MRATGHGRGRFALAAVAVLVLLAAGACSGDGDEGGSSTSTSSTSTGTANDGTALGTVPRDGDPAFCTAIADLQDAYGLVAEPPASATPAEVEADWNTLAAATGSLVAEAPDEFTGPVANLAAVFDQFRLDANALDYGYTSFDDFESSATMDPNGQFAQEAYTLFTYGEERCP